MYISPRYRLYPSSCVVNDSTTRFDIRDHEPVVSHCNVFVPKSRIYAAVITVWPTMNTEIEIM